MIEAHIVFFCLFSCLIYSIYLKITLNSYIHKLEDAQQRIKILSIDVAGIIGSRKARETLAIVTREELLGKISKKEFKKFDRI